MALPDPPPSGPAVATDRPSLALPGRVADALADPPQGTPLAVPAAGLSFFALTWGDGEPLLLMHGITSSSRTWWRVGPALAAAGYRVVAPDLPGHGRTTGRGPDARFEPTAGLMASFAAAAGLELDGPHAPSVVGHSWGAMVAAALPSAGLRPKRLVLLDPPLVLAETAESWASSSEGRFGGVAEAASFVRAENPEWIEGDILAKAEAISQFDEEWALDVVVDNGDWDAGLASLSAPAARGIPTVVVRGEPTFGGLLADEALPRLSSVLGGADRIRTIAGAEHSPQRTHATELVAALLAALMDPL